MGTITANSDGKKLFGDNNVVYFKSICAAYKLHYKIYRGTTVYADETVDVPDGTSIIENLPISSSQSRYLEVEFFDKNGNKFFPYNIEVQNNCLAADSGGNGITTILSDGTLRMIVKDNVSSGTKQISFEYDSKDEEIDSREILIMLRW